MKLLILADFKVVTLNFTCAITGLYGLYKQVVMENSNVLNMEYENYGF